MKRRQQMGLIAGLLFSMLIFAGNAMAVPGFSVSGVSGIWDDKGTPDYSDDRITVEFDATVTGGWTLDSTTVWVFEPSFSYPVPPPGEPYLPDPDPYAWVGMWSPLYDTSRGSYLAEEGDTDPITGAVHYQMVADAIGFEGSWSLSDAHEPQGFFIGYWDGNGNPDAEWGDDDFPEYYKVLADGAISLHDGSEGAEIYPGSSSPSWAFVPEPASLLLLGSGILGLGFWKKKEDLKA